MLCDVLWCHVDIWLVYVGFVYLLKLYVCVFAYVDFMLYVSVYVLLEFEIRIKFM